MARTSRTDQMIALHAEGVRQVEIATRLGVSRSAVSAALRSRGVHDRPDRGYPDESGARRVPGVAIVAASLLRRRRRRATQ